MVSVKYVPGPGVALGHGVALPRNRGSGATRDPVELATLYRLLGCFQTERSDLARVTGIIDEICSSADGCHGSGAGNMSLASGREFTSLILVPSSEVPSLFRVLPGDPADSYVYRKLACEGGIQGSCMPLGGQLTPSLVQSFHDWIEAGAPTQ